MLIKNFGGKFLFGGGFPGGGGALGGSPTFGQPFGPPCASGWKKSGIGHNLFVSHHSSAFLFLFRFNWYSNNTANAYKDLNQLVKIHIYHNKCKYQKGSPKVWVNSNMAPIILHSTLHSVIKVQQLHKYIILQLNKLIKSNIKSKIHVIKHGVCVCVCVLFLLRR